MVGIPEARMGLNEATGLAFPIPSWVIDPALDAVLRGLGAFYRSEPMRVRQGLDADDERNRAYLGTYFPRSVVEWGLVWSELLAHESVRRRFQAKETISIASFGSGTGGDVVGALCAIHDSGLTPRRVRVLSFDGNADALEKQKAILTELQRRGELNFELDLTCRQFTWGLDRESFRKSCDELSAFLPGPVDMIQASKWLVEFYTFQKMHNKRMDAAGGIVEEFLRFSENVVRRDGMVAIADVTTADCGRWFPEVMNGEANDYLARGGALRAISPIPCAFRQGDCPSGHICYTRRYFRVSSSFRMEDKSQLCYRVFAPMDFAQEIIGTYRNIPYRVSWGRKEDCSGGIRGNFIQGDVVPSGFSAYCQNPGA